MESKRFATEKCLWKKRLNKQCLKVDDLAAKFRTGRHIGMGALYETARKLQNIGLAGEKLRKEMDRTDPAIRMRNRCHEDLASGCKLVEIASKIIESIVDTQQTPKISFPSFATDMYSSTAIDTAPLENFEALRRQVEEDENESENQ